MSIPSRWRTIACVLAMFLAGLPAAATAQEGGGSATERAEAEFPSGELEDGTSAADLADEGFPSGELEDGASAAERVEEEFPPRALDDGASAVDLADEEFPSRELEEGSSAAARADEEFPSRELDGGASAAAIADEGFPSIEMEGSAATAVLEEDEFSSSDLKAYADVEERIEALEEEWKNALIDSSSAQEVVSRRAETRQQREDLLHEHGLDLRSYRAIRSEARMNRELRERLDRLADDDTD